jgi:CheY-like chemotaxis protein
MPPTKTPPRSVLVVDDDTMFRESLRDSLEHQGFRVLEASTGDEALQLMADQPVEVLLTDLTMPGLNGVELLRQLRQRSPTTPRAVVMTGNRSIDPSLWEMLSSLGASSILRKPFRLDALLGAINSR